MIENGQRQVAGQLLQTISGVLGVEPTQLLGQREAQVASSIVHTIGNLKAQGWAGPLDEAASPFNLYAPYIQNGSNNRILDRRYTALNRMGARVDRQIRLKINWAKQGIKFFSI